MSDALDPIAISALQHWCYCSRQCGLIHLEQVFQEIIFTQRGQALQKRVDDLGVEVRDGLRVERALPLYSDRLGLVGKADVVEFLPDGTPYALRGVEGEAARQYFAALNLLVRPDARSAFHMDGRTRRPPRGRMNALMSFIYALLMNDCRSAVEASGLDPQIGFLHALRPGRAALALDLMEEFRFLADRLALTLINREQIGPKDFVEREGGAVMLKATCHFC